LRHTVRCCEKVGEAKEDQQWLAQVKKNGGIIVSVDGIQPEKGNETVYVVRDALDLPRAFC